MIIYYNSNRKLVWYVSSLDPVALGSTNSRIYADPKDQGGFWALEIWMKLETKVFSVPPALSEELIETVVQIYQKPSVPHTKCYREPGKNQPSPNPQCNSKNLIAYRLTLAYEDIEELFTSLLFFLYMLHCSPITLARLRLLICTGRFEKTLLFLRLTALECG